MGIVIFEPDDVIPGATVLVESPSLQGTRQTVTNEHGGFILRFLPPGEHLLTVAFTGFQTERRPIIVNVGATTRTNVFLELQSMTCGLRVPNIPNPILQTTQVSANLKSPFITQLPQRRNLDHLIALTPGVQSSGPKSQPVISGGKSLENRYLLNGGVIHSHSTSSPIYIEDAIEEITVITGSASAEYGQFTGGMINTVTKQGGNAFAGSVRFSFEDDDEASRTPIEPVTNDDSNHFQTVTLGGPIIKDRIWFFGAGRHERDKEEDRYELKLTYTPVENHTLVASYLEADVDGTSNAHQDIAPSRRFPGSLLSFNYRGILTGSFSIEAFYSEGEQPSEFVTHTTFETKPEERNNQMYWLKGAYFWNTTSLGNHEIVFGHSNFTEKDHSNYEVHASFVNDVWQLNDHWRFNLGFRFDQNAASRQDNGQKYDDDKLSPRFAAAYDFLGDRLHVVEVGYAEYGAHSNGDCGHILQTHTALHMSTSDEIMLGYSSEISWSSFVKLNYLHRKFKHVLQVLSPAQTEREYEGIQLQADHKWSDFLSFGGNWTWSQLTHNNNGLVAAPAVMRNLNADIRNTGQLWVTYIPYSTIGDITFSLLQRYRAAAHYSTVAASVSIPDTERALPSSLPPSDISETEDLHATDLGIHYARKIKRLEFFLEIELLNLFNNDHLIDPNYINSFGEATRSYAHQTPRTFRFDVGIRFN